MLLCWAADGCQSRAVSAAEAKSIDRIMNVERDYHESALPDCPLNCGQYVLIGRETVRVFRGDTVVADPH